MWLWINFWGDRELRKIIKNEDQEPTKDELKEIEKWTGRLEIVDKDLIFHYGEEQKIKIEISDIKVIGEFTTEADLIATDWYLILVKKNNEVVYLPAYAVGFQETLNQLSKILNYEIAPRLFASVKFDSNIIYPKSVDGEKLFNLKGVNSNSVWEKIKVNMGFSSITPILRNEIIQLKEKKAFLESKD